MRCGNWNTVHPYTTTLLVLNIIPRRFLALTTMGQPLYRYEIYINSRTSILKGAAAIPAIYTTGFRTLC